MALTNQDSIVTVGKLQEARGFFDAFAMMMPALSDTKYASTSLVENPEFYVVIVDSENKIICGVRKDMTYTGLGTAQVIEAIIEIMDQIDNA